MAETEQTVAAYQESVEIFESLPGISPSLEESQRIKHLTDGTQIVVNRYLQPDLFDLTQTQLDTLYADVIKPGVGGVAFMLNRNGLINFHIYPLSIQVGELSIPNFTSSLDINWHGDFMPSEYKSVFRQASKPLIGWLKRIITEDHYSTPPIEISALRE